MHTIELTDDERDLLHDLLSQEAYHRGDADQPDPQPCFDLLDRLDEGDDGPTFTVDIRFAGDGFSVSVYDWRDGEPTVYDEAWHTWAEVEERKGDESSDVTFEIGGGD